MELVEPYEHGLRTSEFQANKLHFLSLLEFSNHENSST